MYGLGDRAVCTHVCRSLCRSMRVSTGLTVCGGQQWLPPAAGLCVSSKSSACTFHSCPKTEGYIWYRMHEGSRLSELIQVGGRVGSGSMGGGCMTVRACGEGWGSCG